MTYVSGAAPSGGCIFCNALSAGDDRKQLVLHRARHAFLMLNAYPYVPGHLMVAPARHVGAVFQATPEEHAEVMRLVGVATRILESEYRAQGFNIGINQGRVAGAGVEDHLHAHVVPRWAGDTNFMPVLNDVRILPEALDTTWERLRSRLGG
jgi:ATP adenylyltransferase